MKIRTFLGVLVGLAIIVAASYMTHHNSGLLTSRVQLGATRSIPLYVAIIGTFLLGFLPPVTALIAQTLKRELAARRRRRQERELQGRQSSLRRALDFHADGQWNHAIEEYERVLAEQPEEFSALVYYGEALRRAGRAHEAVEVHRRASVLYPQSVVMLQQLADDYDAQGESEVGREIRDRILRDFEAVSLRILRRRRNTALGSGRWSEAAELQDRIDQLLRGTADEALLERERGVRLGLSYQRAVQQLEQDRVQEARRAFLTLLAAEPQFIPARIMLGEAEAVSGDEVAAVQAWRTGFEESGNPVFLQRIEDFFIDRGEPVKAIESLRGLIAAAENDLLPRFFLGRLYYRLEMHQEALKVLSGLEERIRTSPTFHLVLARIHQRRGEVGKAVQEYVACIQQAGIQLAEYACRVCGTKYREWYDRCGVCGSWNSVVLDFEEESVSPEALGVREAPVWSVTDDENAD